MCSNKFIILFSLFVSLSLLIQCSHASKTKQKTQDSQPEWINNPTKEYPESMYLSGVGTGDTREAAENNAMGSIARIFKSKIRVDQSVYEHFLETDQNLSSTSQIRRRTNVGAQQELKNIKIKEAYFSPNDGLNYALAVLARTETGKLYRNEFEDNDFKIAEFYGDYQKSKQKLHRYTSISKAKALTGRNNIIKEKYAIIMAGNRDLIASVQENEIDSEMRKLLDQISVNIESENGSADVMDYMEELIGKIGFKIVGATGDFSFNYSLTYKPAELNRNDTQGFNWKLTVSITDNINNHALKTFNIEKRTLGISEEQAKAKMMRSIRKEINESLYNQFIGYVSSI